MLEQVPASYCGVSSEAIRRTIWLSTTGAKKGHNASDGAVAMNSFEDGSIELQPRNAQTIKSSFIEYLTGKDGHWQQVSRLASNFYQQQEIQPRNQKEYLKAERRGNKTSKISTVSKPKNARYTPYNYKQKYAIVRANFKCSET